MRKIFLSLLLYLMRGVIVGILLVWLFLSGVTSIISLVEIVARAAGNPNANALLVAKIICLKLPISLQTLLPFAILLGSVFALLRLRRFNELIIILVSGLRLRAGVAMVAMVGLGFGMIVLVSDDFVAKSTVQYRFYERNVLALQQEKFNEIFTDIKFYQETERSHQYIQLHYVDTSRDNLGSTTIIISDKKTGKMQSHIFATQAYLADTGWLLKNVRHYRPGTNVEIMPEYLFPIRVDFADLITLSRPLDTIGFFALPSFIELAKKTGAQISRYEMQYWQKMITPLLFASFAALALGIVRLMSPRASSTAAVLKCFFWALLLNFGINLIGTLGGGEQISIGVAVAAQIFLPSGIALVVLMRPATR